MLGDFAAMDIKCPICGSGPIMVAHESFSFKKDKMFKAKCGHIYRFNNGDLEIERS